MLITFLFLDKNICCGYSLEAPHRGASNEYPQHMFLSRNKKNIMWIPSLICSYDAYMQCLTLKAPSKIVANFQHFTFFPVLHAQQVEAGLGGLVGSMSSWWSGGHVLDLCLAQQHFFHGDIWKKKMFFFLVILPLPLIQGGQLSVSVERMCTNTGLLLRGQNLPRKSKVR